MSNGITGYNQFNNYNYGMGVNGASGGSGANGAGQTQETQSASGSGSGIGNTITYTPKAKTKPPVSEAKGASGSSASSGATSSSGTNSTSGASGTSGTSEKYTYDEVNAVFEPISTAFYALRDKFNAYKKAQEEANSSTNSDGVQDPEKIKAYEKARDEWDKAGNDFVIAVRKNDDITQYILDTDCIGGEFSLREMIDIAEKEYGSGIILKFSSTGTNK